MKVQIKARDYSSIEGALLKYAVMKPDELMSVGSSLARICLGNLGSTASKEAITAARAREDVVKGPLIPKELPKEVFQPIERNRVPGVIAEIPYQCKPLTPDMVLEEPHIIEPALV